MKRSDALRIIWEAINELEDADHILAALEKAGMLPPKVLVVNGKTLEVTEKNVWEKEDA